MRATGQVAAWERVHFGELTLVPRRSVPYGPVDPVASRDIMIQAALVDADCDLDAPFIRHNRALRERIESSAASSAPAGSAPGAAGVRTVEVIATIQSIDRKARTMTLRGVHRTVKVAVPEGVDMAKIKTGDDVHAVFTEAVVLAVEPAPRPAPRSPT